MNHEGFVRKMAVQASETVSYSLILDNELYPINQYIGQKIQLEFTGKIQCVACSRPIKKSYQQGYCFPCTQKLAQCDLCILKPVDCHHHLGTCREPKWGDEHCMSPHYVYLANSSGIKVGITRQNQVPTRFMDQGAIQAMPIYLVDTRRQSGYLEHELSKHISDKTNWRKMLKGEVEIIDLAAKAKPLLEETKQAFDDIGKMFDVRFEKLLNPKIYQFEYPVLKYPTKITSYNFDKAPIIDDTLMGIKGQYLIFQGGVINIRKFGGYHLKFSA